MTASSIAPSGELSLNVIRGGASHVVDPDPATPALTVRNVIKHGLPRLGLGREVNTFRFRNIPNLWRGAWRHFLAVRLGVGHFVGCLWMTKTRGDGTVLDLGLGSMRVVTTAGAFKIVAIMNTTDTTTGALFKFHGYGTGTTAEAAADTALVTELTTEYVVNSTRPTGTQTVGASNNIYRSVATLAPDSGTPVLREHGLFSASSAGTLLDRTVFAAVTLDSSLGDTLATTYELTLTAGS